MAERSNNKLDHIRREFDLDQLDESKLSENPLQLFSAWMAEATKSEIPDPTAMTLSTVDQNGFPSSRIVLLKEIRENRLIFFTNYHSRKAREILNSPKVAANLYWPQLERQVKITGVATPLADETSDLYFQSRPFESKVSAWASPQSEVVPNRSFLEQEYMKYLEKFRVSKEVPRPSNWGGFAIEPIRMEFWQGGKYRLHDRFEYTCKDSVWRCVRLAP